MVELKIQNVETVTSNNDVTFKKVTFKEMAGLASDGSRMISNKPTRMRNFFDSDGAFHELEEGCVMLGTINRFDTEEYYVGDRMVSSYTAIVLDGEVPLTVAIRNLRTAGENGQPVGVIDGETGELLGKAEPKKMSTAKEPKTTKKGAKA